MSVGYGDAWGLGLSKGSGLQGFGPSLGLGVSLSHHNGHLQQRSKIWEQSKTGRLLHQHRGQGLQDLGRVQLKLRVLHYVGSDCKPRHYDMRRTGLRIHTIS